MKKFSLEVAVGIFVLAGILALGYLSIKLGKLELIGSSGYTVYADFSSVGGLKSGAVVEIAGVDIGRVTQISLDKGYQALVAMRINSGIRLQEDVIASIRTKGLIGEKYVRITPGSAEQIIQPNGKIRETEPPIELEELIGKTIFGKL